MSWQTSLFAWSRKIAVTFEPLGRFNILQDLECPKSEVYSQSISGNILGLNELD